MSSSYNKNIDRLRSAERSNAQTAMSQRTEMANLTGSRAIDNADKLGDQLTNFSKTLKAWRDEDIKQKKEKED